MGDKLGACRLKKGMPYPVSRIGGPRDKWDTLADSEGHEFFSGVGVSTLPEAPQAATDSRRSTESDPGPCREGDPCSNKFLFSLYEGASLLIVAEGKPLGTTGAAEAACGAVAGFSRCFTRVFPHAKTVADVRRLLNRSVMVAHEECSKSNSRYSVTFTAVASVRLQRPVEDSKDDWAVLGVALGQGKAFLLRKDGSQVEDLTEGNYIGLNEEVGYLGQTSSAVASNDLPHLCGFLEFASHAGLGDHVFLTTFATHANFHPSKMKMSAEAFLGAGVKDWTDIDSNSAKAREKMNEHFTNTVRDVLLHKRKSLVGITPSRLTARLAKHVRSSTANARRARLIQRDAEPDNTFLGHATLTALRISEVRCASFEPLSAMKPHMFDEYRFEAVIIGREFDVWKQIAQLSPALSEGLEKLHSTTVDELHLHVGVPGISVKKTGSNALEFSVKSDEEESPHVAKWRSGMTLELQKGSSRAHLRNCYVDIMRSAGLDAQTTTRAADSLVAGTSKCARLTGESKSLSFSQFGAAFRVLLGDMEVEQINGVITHGRGDSSSSEQCIVLRLLGTKASAMEGFLVKLQVPEVARETIPHTTES